MATYNNSSLNALNDTLGSPAPAPPSQATPAAPKSMKVKDKPKDKLKEENKKLKQLVKMAKDR